MILASPGARNDDVVRDTQMNLKDLGFNVTVSGNYDPSTSAAVLEFRDTYGLPHVDNIDEDFQNALADAANRNAVTGNAPPGQGTSGAQPEVDITGGNGSGFPWGWAALFGAGFVWWRSRG